MEMEDYGAVLADALGGKPSNSPRVKYGTVTKVSGSTLDVSLAGGTITGVCMTVSCAGAKVGDRVVLLVDGALVTCLGIVATADNARYVTSGSSETSLRLHKRRRQARLRRDRLQRLGHVRLQVDYRVVWQRRRQRLAQPRIHWHGANDLAALSGCLHVEEDGLNAHNVIQNPTGVVVSDPVPSSSFAVEIVACDPVIRNVQVFRPNTIEVGYEERKPHAIAAV